MRAEVRILGERSDYRLACQAYPRGRVVIPESAPVSRYRRSRPSIDAGSEFGIAVDIGTTTVQISLVDLKSGRDFMLDTFLNTQRRFGDDVTSRIAAAGEPAAFQKQVRLIRDGIMASCAGAFAENLETMRLPRPATVAAQDKVRRINLTDRISLSQGDIRNLQLAREIPGQ